jgi:hypothetical protein
VISLVFSTFSPNTYSRLTEQSMWKAALGYLHYWVSNINCNVVVVVLVVVVVVVVVVLVVVVVVVVKEDGKYKCWNILQITWLYP